MPEITQISQEEFDKNMEDVDNEMIDMAMDTLLKSEELEELHQEVKDQYYDIKKILPTSFNDSLDNYINKAQNFNKNVRIKKQQLLQSEKKVLEDILGDSSGEIIFNDLQEERITKKVNNRINLLKKFKNNIINDCNGLIKIRSEISSYGDKIGLLINSMIELNNKKSKYIEGQHASINTNNRNTFYVDNEINKINFISGIFVFIYYIIFIKYLIIFVKKDKNTISIIKFIILLTLPIFIFPGLIKLFENIINYIKNIYTSGPKNVFLNIEEYEPPTQSIY